MKTRAFAVLALVVCVQTAQADDAWRRLSTTLRTDSSYKVRMKAARVIARRAAKMKARLPDSTIKALTDAATRDEHELVRGMACVALGDLKDIRGRTSLLAARNDSTAFVRAQAEDALRKLVLPPPPPPPPQVVPNQTPIVRHRRPPPSIEESKFFVLSIEGATPEMQAKFRKALERSMAAHGGSPIIASSEATGKGHHLKTVVKIGPASSGFEVEARVVIATWPDNNLRHVVKANARVPVPQAKVSRKLMDKLLSAAADRVARDVVDKMGGS